MNTKLRNKVLQLLLGVSIVLVSLTGCSDKVIEPEHYEHVLEDLVFEEDVEVQDFANAIPFSNADFRLAYAKYIASHTLRQNYLVYNYYEIEMLDLRSVNDLTDLRLFPNVKKLIIRDSADINLAQLNDTNIKIVEVYNSSADMEDISADIEILVFNNTDITNPDAMANLPKIKDLELDFTNVTDISFVKDLKTLDNLLLISNDIEDYSILGELKCKEITLSCTHVDDWSFITEIDSLSYLNLAYTNFNDISLLYDMKKLEDLDLSYTLVDDISGLENLKNLKSVDISACYRLDDYSDVAALDSSVCIKVDNMEMKHNNIVPYNSDSTLSDDAAIKEEVLDFYDSIGITESMTEEEKVRLITIAVLERVTYVSEMTAELSDYCNDNELRSALDGNGLCSSYSALTSELLTLAGIQNYEITGTAIYSEPDFLHKWNIVQVDGTWYGLDLTFLDDLDGANRLKANEAVSYYLSDLDSEEWTEIHYAFYLPDVF